VHDILILLIRIRANFGRSVTNARELAIRSEHANSVFCALIVCIERSLRISLYSVTRKPYGTYLVSPKFDTLEIVSYC